MHSIEGISPQGGWWWMLLLWICHGCDGITAQVCRVLPGDRESPHAVTPRLPIIVWCLIYIREGS